MQKLIWVAMFASFAVKVPMWPFHTWLPDAHVEAPTAGSVLLAGVLLKLGGYGFLRFSLPMLPDASAYFAPFIFALSIVAIIYTSLVALMQSNMKKLIAYSSVAHMGIVTIGIFTPNAWASRAASCRCSATASSRPPSSWWWRGLRPDPQPGDRAPMAASPRDAGLRHRVHAVHDGLGRPARHQRVRRRDPGDRRRLPDSSWVAFFAATGMILGAAYMLWLYRRVIFGALIKDDA